MTDYTRAGAVDRFAEDVLAAAGPETPEETALRAAEGERRFPDRLGDEIGQRLFDDFCMESGFHYLDFKFEIAEEDEDSAGDDPLTLVREDGKRYEIEIDVHVRALS